MPRLPDTEAITVGEIRAWLDAYNWDVGPTHKRGAWWTVPIIAYPNGHGSPDIVATGRGTTLAEAMLHALARAVAADACSVVILTGGA